MRVIYALPERQLRLSGALGPLQAEAVTGTLTFDIRPEGKTAKVTLSYVVGGYMRMGAVNMARLVDNVLAEQLAGLKRASEARRYISGKGCLCRKPDASTMAGMRVNRRRSPRS